MTVDGGLAPSAFTVAFEGLSRQLRSDVWVISGGKETRTVAVWDTGATRTCISSEVAQALGLVPTGKMMIRTPSGSDSVNMHLVGLGLPNKVKVEDVPVCETMIGEQGIGVLVGMDIIALGDFAVTNKNGRTCFSFRMPSMKKIDFVPEIRAKNIIGEKHGQGKRKRKKR